MNADRHQENDSAALERKRAQVANLLAQNERFEAWSACRLFVEDVAAYDKDYWEELHPFFDVARGRGMRLGAFEGVYLYPSHEIKVVDDYDPSEACSELLYISRHEGEVKWLLMVEGDLIGRASMEDLEELERFLFKWSEASEA